MYIPMLSYIERVTRRILSTTTGASRPASRRHPKHQNGGQRHRKTTKMRRDTLPGEHSGASRRRQRHMHRAAGGISTRARPQTPKKSAQGGPRKPSEPP